MVAHHIVLIGMPASGKTATASILADLLGLGSVDLDDEVHRRCGDYPATILRTSGEAELRRQEVAALAVLLAGPGVVIASGGGLPTSEAARKTLAATDVVTVWLTAALGELDRRSRGDDTDRPLLDGTDALGKLWHERRRHYLAASDLVVATDGRTPSEVAGLVAARLGATPP